MELSPRQEPTTLDLPYAGFWIRLIAYLLDSLIIFIVSSIPFFFIRLHYLGGKDELTTELVLNGISVLLGWFYYAGMESSKYQATLGKQMMGIFVTDTGGYRLSFLHATGRFFAKIPSSLILLIGFIMAAFTARKQALHDIIAGTLVYRHQQDAEV
ncbi:RDD family protein [Pontibacter ruber]|uniref:RDD family protein n=1 Tax=Pontibacter ruber TaxID=1343895 RepID=A0ABW5CTY1_9BACT|nr:RDD family protein [Pontibacter ruber]